MNKRTFLLLFLLTVIGACLHFYNLTWGSPYYFNPDERNIASAASQLQFPQQMNPHFFAYGSLPIYAIYFAGMLANYVSHIQTITFEQAILISRVFSALFATLLIPLLFLLGKKLQNRTAGLLAAFLATTSTGFIQFAHFGTFEMWLTFFGVLLFWFCLRYLTKPQKATLIFIGVTFGILVSIKVSSLVLLLIPLIIFITKQFSHYKQEKKNVIRNSLFVIRSCRDILLFTLISILVYILTNPYSLLDQKDLLLSMHYESSVALGTEPVFYTQTFDNTLPGIYQFLHVYPFLINPLVELLFIPAFISLLFTLIKDKNKHFLLVTSFFLLLFVSQAFLFVKWTRYMIPTLPFVYLIIALTSTNNLLINKLIKRLFLGSLIIICTIFSLSYLITVFLDTDTRLSAVTFAQRIIPVNAVILSEPSDLGDLPFQDAFPNFNTFSFYDLDSHLPDATETQLQQKLMTAQYIILPSQRILQSRIGNQQQFPKGNKYYESLLNGNLGFHKIYETPCDIFCTITYLGDPVYWWEQTVSVFDRPTVFIFKKSS